ncbi:MAG: cation:proton antiporter, partial [Pseudomonadota bacterium]|nr:cation:proton antiporter [Pseudomonadota bacterium]
AALMRLRQPPMAGYVLAGLILGPGALGAVGNDLQIGLLAETGIALLLFMIGAQLSLRAFLATWKTAIAAVALQTAISLTVMFAGAWLLGLSPTLAILLGLTAGLSSAAVATAMLHQSGAAKGRVGRITTGILIAQSLAFLPMLLVVDHLGANAMGAELIGKIVIAAALLAMLVIFLGRGKPIDLPVVRGVTGGPDLAPMTALAYCLAAAGIFGFLGLSAPFGAFLAGLIIGRSNQRKRMMTPFRQLQNILVMAVFLSIGLLTDLGFIADNPGAVLFLLLLIALVGIAANAETLRALGQSWRDAGLAGLSLSQPGEFSIILAGAAVVFGAVGPAEFKLVVAVIGLGLILSPLWMVAARRVRGIADGADLSLGEISATAFGDGLAALCRHMDHVRHGEFRAIADELAVKRQLNSAPAATPLPANDDEDPPIDDDAGTPEPDTADTIAAIGAGVRAARFGDLARRHGEPQ